MRFRIVEDNSAKIRVIGIGGGGGNAVSSLVSANLKGVSFIAANTDLQALETNPAPIKVQLGRKLTKGLGAGADPELGRNAALEDKEAIKKALDGSDMVFITAGLGGGTGTGGAPVVADISKGLRAVTVAVVTKPFHFEGKKRLKQAEDGLRELRKKVHTLIAIPNDLLLDFASTNITFLEMLRKADDVLLHAVKAVSDLVTVPGLINLDFADITTVMSEMGMAFMGTGVGHGDNRAVDAARKAIYNPLMEDVSIDGARGVLINITGSSNMTLDEIREASTFIQGKAHQDANIIWGAVIDDTIGDEIRITVIATGIEVEEKIKHLGLRSGYITRPKKGDMDVPTYMRKDKVSQTVDLSKYIPPRGLSDEDLLEIPTFLRRQEEK